MQGRWASSDAARRTTKRRACADGVHGALIAPLKRGSGGLTWRHQTPRRAGYLHRHTLELQIRKGAKTPLPRNGGWGEIKRRAHKPVSVFESAIYLRNLPPDIGRAALICQYIWSCRPWCRTRTTSLPYAVSSCLTFSPSPPGQARRQTFSVTAGIRLLPSALSAAGCPSLSGLSSPAQAGAADRPALIRFCKYNHFSGFSYTALLFSDSQISTL